MIKTPLSTVIGGAFWTPGATILSSTSKSKTFDQIIESLFANNEQGFVYDPNDLSTMFQDAAGTVPATGAGQPVGLILDKSKSLVLGAELISDVNFDNAANWILQPNGTPTITIANGIMSFNTITNDRALLPNANIVANKYYTITIEVSSYVRGDPFIFIGGRVVFIPKSVGRHTLGVFTALSSSDIGIFSGRLDNGGGWSATSVSIKEIAGNHASQTTSSMRPLLVASPQHLDYDTVDDKLITTLPAQLTGCTVVRAVPNVGTQILTGQTIPTPYNGNTNHCGLLVINRALTATETSQITNLFNKAAGV
ncbi:hypothetical protein [Acinetobacter sp. Lyrl_1]|uniref:hypothetical protein n=1 Tax=Acinetobacter sp. Lyrl_1 TaxID=3110920 RepID=UPI003F7BFA99